ncbi:hypothetical protein Zmor_024194 [Zophobas morio]|uniref:Uncharacterized protein n=1 Tax=Zophobas morio TaxID=2755281 RepID=A0AA38M7W7_9CUCU|nr:hypothetical protein Zmor_024194 [Zophobas morio]
MNKGKKSEPKKILVRNTELPVPKTRLLLEGKSKIKEKPKTEEPNVHKTKSANSRPKFHVPELHSTLKISDKIDKLEKTKPQKFQKDVAFCEKVTRKVNFPADRPIYKDLIPLQVPAKSPPVLSSREPLPQKDKEPSLSSYAHPTAPREYIYVPSIKTNMRSTSSSVDNLHLYKVMQMFSQ